MSPNSTEIKILLLEDDPDLAEFLELILAETGAGFHVIHVARLAEAHRTATAPRKGTHPPSLARPQARAAPLSCRNTHQPARRRQTEAAGDNVSGMPE